MKRDFSLFTGLLKTARHGDDMVMTGIASSTVRDRHGDTMTPKALESMLKSADGMTIYLNHSYNVPEDVAGTVRSAWIDKSAGDLHDLHFEIGMNGENPRAVQAFNAIEKGTKLGLSIGAMIPEGGAKRTKSGSYVIDEVELLETSIVSIPANPRSWVEYARKSLMTKSDIPELDEEVIEGDGSGEALPPVEDDPHVQHEPVVERTYAAKKGHEHPHAHAHAHDHEHWDGIKHAHPHAHTHAHAHGDEHEHVDDMQGDAHNHYHSGAFEEDHGHDSDTSKSFEIEDLAAHLASHNEAAVKAAGVVEHFPQCNDQCDPTTNTHHFESLMPEGEGSPAVPAQDLGDAVSVINSTDDLDTTKSKVTVWPSGKVSVETPAPSQEATPQAEPEIEDAPDALSAQLGEMSKDLEPDVIRLLGPTVMASLQTSTDMIGALVVAVEKAVTRADAAERERDEVVKAAATLTETVEAFITRVAATPRGRRAVAREIPQTVKALEGIRGSGLYSDQFMDILEKGTPQ
jgi:HK97 family phage prohead protease